MKKYLYLVFSTMLILTATICSGGMHSEAIHASNSDLVETAKSAVIIDYNSGDIIYQKNAHTRLPVASMVKLMTILITCEEIENGNLSLDTKIQTTENASKMGGSQVFIDPYVSYSCEDLLKSVIMASANDASVALAEHISGSENEFVSKMNKKAGELGLKNTLYSNCTGLPAPEQYSCAYDCALILKNLIDFENYHKYSEVWMTELVHPSGRKTELVNTNKLIRYYSGCDCGKTGSTNEAGYCLTASAKKNDMRLIGSVVGAKSGQQRFKEVSSLFNYGFANFSNQMIVDNSVKLESIEIFHSKNKICDIYAKNSFYALSKKGEKDQYKTSININEGLKAPLNKNDIIGNLIITKDGKVVKEIDIIILEDVEKISYFDSVKKITTNW